MIGVTAGEASNPRETVPKAIKGTFWRILLFYTGSVFVMGLLLPYTTPELKADAPNKTSPFTLGLQLAGIPAAADIINAVIVIALLSAGNSAMYVSSRTLMALANNEPCLKFFAKTTKSGIPLNALLPTFLFGLIAVVSSIFSDVTVVFDWIMNLMGFNGCIIWMMICFVHLRFRSALEVQGIFTTKKRI